jgi:hypothetical protein
MHQSEVSHQYFHVGDVGHSLRENEGISVHHTAILVAVDPPKGVEGRNAANAGVGPRGVPANTHADAVMLILLIRPAGTAQHRGSQTQHGVPEHSISKHIKAFCSRYTGGMAQPSTVPQLSTVS